MCKVKFCTTEFVRSIWEIKGKQTYLDLQAPTGPCRMGPVEGQPLTVEALLRFPSSMESWERSQPYHSTPPSPLIPITACDLHCAFAFPHWQPFLMDSKALALLPPPHQPHPNQNSGGTNGCLQDGNISGAFCHFVHEEGRPVVWQIP